MGCGSCSNNGIPKGCKSNGSCGVKGCEKQTVFDWLSDMEQPGHLAPFDCVEVRFKNGRKEYYKNVNQLKLYMGDVIAVEGNPGHDVGAVSLTGELVRMQMNKRKLNLESPDVRKVYRKVNQRDIDIWKTGQDREQQTMVRSRQIVKDLELNMKVSDVEYQGDNAKATFYYIADERVDFRELIKLLAGEFKIRVEMRQIGSRQEAGKIGGLGSCGRELCCSTWLTDFRSVNTAAARYQQLSLNPTKLAGQCGKLKCCLNYELDTYLDALKNFPDTQKNLETKAGKAFFQKMDIFKELMWYSLPDQNHEWVPISLENVKNIIAQNEKGEKPETLADFNAQKPSAESVAYENVVGQDELTRFDSKTNNRRKTKRRPNRPVAKSANGAESATKEPRPKRRPVQNRNTPKTERKNPASEPKGVSNGKEKPSTESRGPSANANRNRKRRRPNNKPGNSDAANS
jgi:cell fate regulator YaaT (PSP1 superfamily)